MCFVFFVFSNYTSIHSGTLIYRYNGRAILKPTVPDTITSWVITAFSVDPVYGLGLIEAPTKVVFIFSFVTSYG